MTTNTQKLAIAIGLLKERKSGYKISILEHQSSASMGMPIVEIDGVKNLDCGIAFYHENKGVMFYVDAEFKCAEEDRDIRLYFKSNFNATGITEDDILAFSSELLKELPQLRLKLNGRLGIKDDECVSLRAAFEDVFTAIECDTVKVNKTGVCSVCYEKTDTKTPCKHPLCNRCWSKIGVCGDEHNQTPCPLCRENIYYV
jgi:hypothetical protein